MGNYGNYESIINFVTLTLTLISHLLFKVVNLKFAMCVLRFFYLGPSLILCEKRGTLCMFLKL